jgi:hypothetical protein
MRGIATCTAILQSLALYLRGGGSVIVMAAALLDFFGMQCAAVFQAVPSDLRDAIAAFTWNNGGNILPAETHALRWRACFPNARAANLCSTMVPAKVFVLLRDLVVLNFSNSRFPAAALVAEHYPRLTSLKSVEDERNQTKLRFTDAGLAAIPRQCPVLTSLELKRCSLLTSLAGL